jgi:hypothetical protein
MVDTTEPAINCAVCGNEIHERDISLAPVVISKDERHAIFLHKACFMPHKNRTNVLISKDRQYVITDRSGGPGVYVVQINKNWYVTIRLLIQC